MLALTATTRGCRNFDLDSKEGYRDGEFASLFQQARPLFQSSTMFS